LEARLHRLGYQQKNTDPDAPGQYRLTPDHLDLYPESESDAAKPQPVRLILVDGMVQRLVSLPDEAELSEVRLDPPLISGIVGQAGGLGHARIRREWLPISQMPRQLVDAVLAVEDHRFYRHGGVDPIAIGRALWENLGLAGPGKSRPKKIQKAGA
jgi:penicillin-binding protein 1B